MQLETCLKLSIPSRDIEQDVVTKSVFNRLPVPRVLSLNTSPAKPTTLKIDTCRYLAWHSAFQGLGKDWLAHYQDNVTE